MPHDDRHERFAPGPALLLLAALLFAAGPTHAIGTITDGSVTFGYTDDFATSFGDTVDTQFIGAATGDLTWESWWFYRVAGDTRETAFGTPDAESYTGSIGRLDWDDPTGSGDFSAFLRMEVMDTGAGMGNLFQNLTILNTGTSVLTIDIFHYTDLDVENSFGGDSASLVPNPEAIEIAVGDGGDAAPIIAYGADAYQVTPYRTVLNALTDGNVDDLDDSGLPFAPADYTGAFQWSLTIGVGEAEDFVTQFGSNAPLLPRSTSAVPEPGTALGVGLGCALLSARRRSPRT